ncbi:hypothetical protein INR49_031624 [Caranx melampygus]|nr:hypothetical protein INR49_031624 [Caranx melampygus]
MTRTEQRASTPAGRGRASSLLQSRGGKHRPEELFRRSLESSQEGWASETSTACSSNGLRSSEGRKQGADGTSRTPAHAAMGRAVSRAPRCRSVTTATHPGMESINTGPFMMRSTCRRCGGKGSIITTSLRSVPGLRSDQEEADGDGACTCWSGRQPDRTHVQRSPVFRRNGADIHSDVPVLYAGDPGGLGHSTGPLPTISILIPAGCQADQVIRLQGKGIRRMNSYSYGDHYVHIKIRVPKKLTRRQRSLMLSFAEEETTCREQSTVRGQQQQQQHLLHLLSVWCKELRLRGGAGKNQHGEGRTESH